MKTDIHYLVIIILLIICAVLLFINYKAPIKAGPTGQTFVKMKSVAGESQAELKNEGLKIIMNRKSVRKYTSKAITDQQIDAIIRAGMAAPTAANKQPWAFIVIKNRKTLEKLAENLPYCKMAKNAQAAIVVCGVPEWGLPPENREAEYWIQDCSAASENILLAAEALGLGAVWTGVYPVEERVRTVRDILGIPQNVIPLNVIPVGYPAGEEKPKDKYKPERIHFEKW